MHALSGTANGFYPNPPISGHKPPKCFPLTEALPTPDTGSNAFRVPAMLLPLAADLSQEQAVIVKETLPATALDLANLIGLPATLALIDEFGGTDISVPIERHGKAAAFFQRIVDVVGEEAAASISKVHGGCRLYIPRCVKTRQVLRDMEIVQAFDAMTLETSVNKAVSTLAKRYFLSCRAIENIVNRPAFSVGGKS